MLKQTHKITLIVLLTILSLSIILGSGIVVVVGAENSMWLKLVPLIIAGITVGAIGIYIEKRLTSSYKAKKKQFILDTLLPYFEDFNSRGYEEDNSSCEYLTSDGRKCAVGKWMKVGPWQYQSGTDIGTLVHRYSFKEILVPKAYNIGLSLKEWEAVQTIHDVMERHFLLSPHEYDRLVNATHISFPELEQYISL